MIKKTGHVALAVKDTESALKFYRDTLGFTVTTTAKLAEIGLNITVLTKGQDELELLEPTSADGDVAKFIRDSGEGLHHICFDVDDIVGVLEKLEKQGIQLLNKEPVSGIGSRIAFLCPPESKGVLIELREKVKE